MRGNALGVTREGQRVRGNEYGNHQVVYQPECIPFLGRHRGYWVGELLGRGNGIWDRDATVISAVLGTGVNCEM